MTSDPIHPDPVCARLQALIHDVPDFPKPGIVFKDITPLLADAQAFSAAIERLAGRLAAHGPAGIVAIESRGFIFGAALARELRLPLLPVRKPGKLPRKTVAARYELEYGSDALEMHADAIRAGVRYAVVDDVIATGGTAAATAELVRSQGGAVACYGFLIELSFLDGRRQLDGAPLEALIRY
ncbi:MAG: adenine phosphoribosyltransferase [Sinobacteraceae bacterium]|nr:adenine phosphoribosyltransferase [Nevskiaceae bacterium]